MDSIISAATVTPLGTPDEFGFQNASIEIDEVIWQTTFPSVGGDQPSSPVIAVGEQEVWLQAMDALSVGATVPFGLSTLEGGQISFTDVSSATHTLDFGFRLDGDGAIFLGESPFAERDTGQLEAFLSYDGNPLQGSHPLDLLTAWNIEADAPAAIAPITGPISLSFRQMWFEMMDEIYPRAGSPEWWAKSPPYCRSIMDAPAKALESLKSGAAWVQVPATWTNLADGVICLQISIASLGCGDPTSASSFPYLYWDETLAVANEPIIVQVAKVFDDGAISWVERTTIGQIPFEVFMGTQKVIVELDPAFTPLSYGQVAALSAASQLSSVRSLSHEEHQAILDATPLAEEEPPCDACP